MKAFSSTGRLNAHLLICGVEKELHKCNQCGKAFGTKENLYTHIMNTHRTDIVYQCPICTDKNYNSQGGFYKHLHTQHNICRSGIKLSDFLKCESKPDPQPFNITESSTDTNTTNNQSTDGIKTETEAAEVTPKSKAKPKKSEISNDTENRKPLQKPTVTNKGCKRGVTPPDISDVPPCKAIRSTGPTTWDCPLCEGKKYKSEENYYKDLFVVHQIMRPGKKISKPNIAPSKSGKK